MTILSLDYETRSKVDLFSAGLHAYARDPSTRVLMCGWAIDDQPARLWEPHVDRKAPAELREAMRDPSVVKAAWNAPFEAAITEHVLRAPVDNWRDTMVIALYASLPGSLAAAGAALHLSEDKLKMPEGKRLIRKFSLPRKPTKTNPLEWNDWLTDPEDWKLFGDYCVRDVEVEREIRKKLSMVTVPESEWDLLKLDQEINTRGVPVDVEFVQRAIEMGAYEKQRLQREVSRVTGLKSLTAAHFLPWAQQEGYPFGDLRKQSIERAMRDFPMSEKLIDVLRMRSEAGKTSLAKFGSILEKTRDGRIYNMLQFYGASRTGRWGGRDPQPQNLPRPIASVEGQEERVTEMVRADEYDDIAFEFGGVIPVLSSLIRSSFRAREGYKFFAADLNAIENRVLGWVAGCDAILEVFRKGLCPYLSFGTRMYGQSYEELEHEFKVLKIKKKRTDAKPAVLGGGYMLSGGEEETNKAGDIIKTGLWGYAESMGIRMTRDQAHESVRIFRESYPEVVMLWKNLKDAAFECVMHRTTIRVGPVVFNGSPGLMRIKLPNGRILHYLRPRIETVMREFKRKREDGTIEVERKPVAALSYEGVDQKTKKWGRVYTHGGKLTENIVQAIARDVLAEGLTRAKKSGFEIVLHVHDEIVCEVADDSKLTVSTLCDLMSAPMPWAKDLPLAAEGHVSVIYKK